MGLGTSFGFRSWSCASFLVSLFTDCHSNNETLDFSGCLDTSYRVTLIDKAWLNKQLPGQHIQNMAISLKMRGFGLSKHKINKYVTIPL